MIAKKYIVFRGLGLICRGFGVGFRVWVSSHSYRMFASFSHRCIFKLPVNRRTHFFSLSIEGHISFFSAYADSLPAFTGMMCFAHLTYHGSPSPPGSHRVGWAMAKASITHRIRMPLPSAGWLLPCRRRRPCRSMTPIYTAGHSGACDPYRSGR